MNNLANSIIIIEIVGIMLYAVIDQTKLVFPTIIQFNNIPKVIRVKGKIAKNIPKKFNISYLLHIAIL
jgi:hypothetical protein